MRPNFDFLKDSCSQTHFSRIFLNFLKTGGIGRLRFFLLHTNFQTLVWLRGIVLNMADVDGPALCHVAVVHGLAVKVKKLARF
jgi:hypothetical protein